MSSTLPEIRFISSSLAPVWHVVSAPDALKRPEAGFFELLLDLVKQTLLPEHVYGADFRSMSIDRLPFVLKHGIDVEPTNSVIYVDFFDKALEYGGWPKLLLALDPRQLHRTFEEVDVTASVEQLESLRQTYQTEHHSEGDAKIWFSRLNREDPRLASNYEIAYAKYIPGDSKVALLAAFVFAGPEWSPPSNIAL